MKKLIFSVMLAVVAVLTARAQDITVHGTVVSATDGDPLIGASVVCGIEGPNGVATDLDGNFVLTVPEGAQLIVSYIGYQTKTVMAEPEMTIALEEDSQLLDDVVVVGYATQRKVDVTGAITSVDVKEIAKQNENNPIKALQGRVPGMNISAEGNPSGSATVRIRGVGTLNNNDPLYIIDGVPTKAGMHELNPNDIESIQVLKDAASASIYGSRAANGVIIITTKKGNDLKITLDASIAAQFYSHRMKVLNAEGYGRAMWQAFVNGGEDPNTNGLGYKYKWGYDTNGYPVLHSISMEKYLDAAGKTPAADTDWFDETTRTGLVQNYNMSISGSTEKLSAFFSLGYYKNIGIIKYTDFERFSARTNTEFKPYGKLLTIGEHFTLNRTDEVQQPGGFLQNVLQFNPSLPVYTTDGEFAGPVGGYPDRENPLARLSRNKDNRYIYWRLFGDAYVNLNPFEGFNLRTTFGLDYSQKQQRFFTYPITEGNVANSTNAIEAKQEHWTRWMWNAVANYNIDFGKNHFDALAGIELIRETSNWFSGYKMDFSVLNPDYMWPDAGVGQAQAYGSGDGFSLVSFFAKANYSYDSRYLLGVTVRHDGSSRFGANNRYATFPSVSLGWRINNESFLQDASWLSDLKLRLSWGETGNQEISNLARYFVYVPNYGVNDSGGQSYGTSYDIAGTNGGSILQSGFKRNQIGNPDIKWETTTQYNIGIDWSMFASRFYGSLDAYFKKTTDILVNMQGISAMGEGAWQWINAGEMNNKGIELNLGYRNDTSYGLHYEISGNISAYRNKITKIPTTVAANGTFGGNGVYSVIGHTFGAQAGYVADGLFQSQDEVDNHAIQEGAAPGRIRWRDLDHNGVIDERDQKWIYNPTPDFTYGLNVYLQYKDFDFSMFWQGAQGQDVISDLKKETDLWSGLNIGFLNKGERLLDAWTPQHTNTSVPAIIRSDPNNEKRVSTFYVENGSYLKLRNIQIGYVLPSKLSEKLKMQKLRFYISAQNLLTVKSKNFTGVDPENPNYGYPIPTNVTFGFNVTF
ncbi:MAG: TonB-dependent receptor [Muribaculaceae bacterium]|nr:TonB-dependent receptor [Muribaculaceae bacterium]